jgi:hypothetical protein
MSLPEWALAPDERFTATDTSPVDVVWQDDEGHVLVQTAERRYHDPTYREPTVENEPIVLRPPPIWWARPTTHATTVVASTVSAAVALIAAHFLR